MKNITTAIFTLVFTLPLLAQGPQLDSAMVGRNVLELMPDGVEIIRLEGIATMLDEHVRTNSAREVNGYRIRIYFDNSQKSRTESESVALNFKESFPEIPVYRTFSSPYFKVTVGNYRTRSEALAALKGIQAIFPAAFIVKDHFKFPSL